MYSYSFFARYFFYYIFKCKSFTNSKAMQTTSNEAVTKLLS